MLVAYGLAIATFITAAKVDKKFDGMFKEQVTVCVSCSAQEEVHLAPQKQSELTTVPAPATLSEDEKLTVDGVVETNHPDQKQIVAKEANLVTRIASWRVETPLAFSTVLLPATAISWLVYGLFLGLCFKWATDYPYFIVK
jgi:hypothetical protein